MINVKELKDKTYSIIVPKGIRYISQWENFNIFPYPHIMDKQIPGCGFTEYCLTNNQDLILCSPRKLLLENKYDQHKGDIFYVVNEFEPGLSVDKDITKSSKIDNNIKEDPEEINKIEQLKIEFYNKLKLDIETYIIQRRSHDLPFKIIVTYDSFYIVKNILKESNLTISNYLKNEIQFVVDEFQSIFVDATFKSSTENNFIISLGDINRVCYVSATPMIETYLRQIELFRDLPYYELDWSTDDPARVKKPKLMVKVSRSISYTTKLIIQSYLDGKFSKRFIKRDGVVCEVESKEAVFYLNSVNNILNIIKKLGLRPEQVNILCSNTADNIRRVKKKLGRKFDVGKIPLKGEPHKMFTFCTRTVYLGADFYSTNARTFILSDANIDTLAVDISLDLPQILGRQRLIENPWKDEAEFFYRSTCSNKLITKKQLDRHIQHKMEETNYTLSLHKKAEGAEEVIYVNKLEYIAINKNYKDDYVAVNKILVKPGVYVKKPIVNNLVIIAERRAFDIQQIDYKDRFSIFSELENNNLDSDYQQTVIEFFKDFEQLGTISEKLKYFCEYDCSEDVKVVILNQITEKHFHEYLGTMTKDELKSCGYNITLINKRLGFKSFNKTIFLDDVLKNFIVGNRYKTADIKALLLDIYKKSGYDKVAKATDLGEYFEIKEIKLKDETGKWVHGFEIIKKKE